VSLTPPRALQDLRTFVFRNHALELNQELIFRAGSGLTIGAIVTGALNRFLRTLKRQAEPRGEHREYQVGPEGQTIPLLSGLSASRTPGRDLSPVARFQFCH